MNEPLSMLLREALRVLSFVGENFARTWPLMAFSMLLAAAVRVGSLEKRLKQILSMRPIVSVFAATLFGAFSPLCSFTVIPVVFTLLSSGVPIAPVVAFWLASPSMDPEIFLLSVSALGVPLAMARLAAATMMSLGGGMAALALDRIGFFKDGVLRSDPKASCTAPDCSRNKPPKPILYRFAVELAACFFFVGKFMAIAFTLEALILFYLPADLIRTVLGTANSAAIPLAVLTGIPLYATNAQALGTVAGLIRKGMSEGAALAFLIAGATTTLPALSAVIGIAKLRPFIVYLGSAVAAALFSGFLWAAART